MILILFALYCLHGVFTAPTPTTTLELADDGSGADIFVTNYRSTSSIVITCLSTILLCTWHAAHPNVREYNPPLWITFMAKLRLFLLALVMPELLMTFAFNQYVGAHAIAKEIGNGWTLVEGHFLQMGGFIFLCDQQYRFLPPEGILHPAQAGNDHTDAPLFHSALEKLRDLRRAHITKSDILGRSKASGITKFLTMGQTTWFIVQTIARLVQGLTLTELEVITLSYAALHGVTSYLWWGKPLDVQSPIVIELDSLGPPSPPSLPGTSESAFLKVFTAVPRSLTTLGQAIGELMHEMGGNTRRKAQIEVITAGPLDPNVTPKEDETAGGKSSEEASSQAQPPPNQATLISKVALGLAYLILSPLILIICLVCFVILPAFIYVFCAVVGMGSVVFVVICVVVCDTALSFFEKATDYSSANWISGHHSFSPFYYAYSPPKRDWKMQLILRMILRFVGSLSGALHCISWGLERHRTLWRVCSLVITISPLVGAILNPSVTAMLGSAAATPGATLDNQTATTDRTEGVEAVKCPDGTGGKGAAEGDTSCPVDASTPQINPERGGVGENPAPPWARFLTFLVMATVFIAMMIYFLSLVAVALAFIPARAILVVVSFLNLSNMPASAHQAVRWSGFFPHL